MAQFENVLGTWVAIEFGSKRKTHASSRLKIGELLIGKGFHSSRLQTFVRTVLGHRRVG
ncbi:MAG: hypothetical protein ACREMY_05985 [bacterium]